MASTLPNPLPKAPTPRTFEFGGGTNIQVAQMVKNLSAMQEIQVWSLGGEDLLEKGMATYSSILSWRIPWTEEQATSMGHKELAQLSGFHLQSFSSLYYSKFRPQIA